MLRHSQFDHSCPLVVINLHVPRMKCMKWTIPMVKSWNCIARGAPQWDTSRASENANRTRRGRGGFPRSKSERQKGASVHWKTAEICRNSWCFLTSQKSIINNNMQDLQCKTLMLAWYGSLKMGSAPSQPGFLHRNSSEKIHRRFHLLPSLAAWVQRRSSFFSSDPTKNAKIWMKSYPNTGVSSFPLL